MATADSVKAKIQGLIDSANDTTGNEDEDLTTAVQALIDGFGQGGGGGLAYDMGEFVLDSDSTSSRWSTDSAAINITHKLGERPEFILVWTDDYVGVTNPDANNATSLGFAWFDRIMGLDNWYGVSSWGLGTTVNFTQSAGGTNMNVVKPTSATYICRSENTTDTTFALVKIGGSTYWRGGTTYKYFVSKAWWNVGGVASAE